MRLQEDPEKGFRAVYLYQGNEIVPSRAEIWENGKLLFRAEEENEHSAVILVKEGNRYCGVMCTPSLTDCLLIRLLLCEEEGLKGFTRLGTWYGNPERDLSRARQRTDASSRTAEAVQVWQVGQE